MTNLNINRGFESMIPKKQKISEPLFKQEIKFRIFKKTISFLLEVK